MQSHPILLKFSHQADIVASYVLPATVAAKAGVSQGEPLAPRLRADIDTVLMHVLDAIQAEGLNLAVGSVDLAILVGKAFIGSDPTEGEAYDIVIPVNMPPTETGQPKVTNSRVVPEGTNPKTTDSGKVFPASSPDLSAASGDAEIPAEPQDPGMQDSTKPLDVQDDSLAQDESEEAPLATK